MVATAKNIKLPENPDLLKVFGDVGTTAYNTIGDNYDDAATSGANDLKTLGRMPGSNSYAAERLPAQQALDISGLEGALGGGLGEAGYTDWKSEREFQQNKKLAEAIAEANSPSLFDQVLSGINGGAKMGGDFYGAYGALNKNKGSGGGSLEQSLSLYDNGSSGFDRYMPDSGGDPFGGGNDEAYAWAKNWGGDGYGV